MAKSIVTGISWRVSAALGARWCSARLYLGEINDNQREAWCRVIEAFDEQTHQHTQLALFPAQEELPEYARDYGIQVRVDRMELHRPRQWGACWQACDLYE